MVPCSACLWFLRNFGSVPLSEGYRLVLGFLILRVTSISDCNANLPHRALSMCGSLPLFSEECDAYPFLCAFFDWLCWDEFFDSAQIRQYITPTCFRHSHDILAMATMWDVFRGSWSRWLWQLRGQVCENR